MANPQNQPYTAEHFPPPPSEAGAGQSQDLPWSQQTDLKQNTSAQPTTSEGTYYPPPPPGPYPGTQSGPVTHNQTSGSVTSYQTRSNQDYEQPPPLPERHQQHNPPAYNPQTVAASGNWQPPPKRLSQQFGDDDPLNPIHYTRDPHKLVAYLVPFPKPQIKGVDPATIPLRFLIYTPPPPPLSKPAEGEKEGKLHKVQRKWQEEVRGAKTTTAQTASWQGLKSKATRGINKAMEYTTTSNLDFLGRVNDNGSSDSTKDRQGDDGVQKGEKTVGVEQMVLIYPPAMNMSERQMREEFVNTMLRTKSKAQRDAIIATGLMPVAYGIDILATLIWPFGGLGEIDTVWAYASLRGAKTARSVTKRLNSSSGTTTSTSTEPHLHLNFTSSPRIELLRLYLASECQRLDSKLFPSIAPFTLDPNNPTAPASTGGHPNLHPTETDVLTAIGWTPSSTQEEKNWEDEQWERTEVKEDLKTVMKKGAREWKKWCGVFEKEPQKALTNQKVKKMAKSSRSSVRKRNNAKLRSTVFGPAADARTERLSAKLQELAALPGPSQKQETSMDIGNEDQSTDEAPQEPSTNGEMDIDMNDSKTTTASSTSSKKKKASKNDKKKLNRKAKNSIAFHKPGQKGGKFRVSKKK